MADFCQLFGPKKKSVGQITISVYWPSVDEVNPHGLVSVSKFPSTEQNIAITRQSLRDTRLTLQ